MMMSRSGDGLGRSMIRPPLSAAQIASARLAAWQQLRPQPQPTLEDQIVLAEELIYWLEQLWLEDEDVRKAMDEDEYFDFVNLLQKDLHALLDQ